MGEHSEAFVGIDVAKVRNAIAIADGERGGEVRYLGEVDACVTSMTRIVRRLAEKYDRVQFCYEAGPTGYGLHRLITALGHACMVGAPSSIPRRPGERVKTTGVTPLHLPSFCAPGNSRRYGCRTKATRPCATWCVPGLLRSRRCASTSSRSALSCSSMAGQASVGSRLRLTSSDAVSYRNGGSDGQDRFFC